MPMSVWGLFVYTGGSTLEHNSMLPKLVGIFFTVVVVLIVMGLIQNSH